MDVPEWAVGTGYAAAPRMAGASAAAACAAAEDAPPKTKRLPPPWPTTTIPEIAVPSVGELIRAAAAATRARAAAVSGACATVSATACALPKTKRLPPPWPNTTTPTVMGMHGAAARAAGPALGQRCGCRACCACCASRSRSPTPLRPPTGASGVPEAAVLQQVYMQTSYHPPPAPAPESPQPLRTPESLQGRRPVLYKSPLQGRRTPAKSLQELLASVPKSPQQLQRTSWAKSMQPLFALAPEPVPAPEPEPLQVPEPLKELQELQELEASDAQELQLDPTATDPETLPRRARCTASAYVPPLPVAAPSRKRRELQEDTVLVLRSATVRALINDRTPLLTSRGTGALAVADDAAPRLARELPIMYSAGMPVLPRALEGFYAALATEGEATEGEPAEPTEPAKRAKRNIVKSKPKPKPKPKTKKTTRRRE